MLQIDAIVDAPHNTSDSSGLMYFPFLFPVSHGVQLDALRGEVSDRRSSTFREFYMFCFNYAK